MKGPFATYGEALKNAAEGECVMVRNERYYPNEAWCVMTSREADAEYAKGWMQVWIIWETVKVAA